MEKIKELLLRRVEESLKKIEEIGEAGKDSSLEKLLELRDEFIDETARCCGFRYLYYFLKYPEADPLGLSEDILKAFNSILNVKNSTKEVGYALRSGLGLPTSSR